MRRSTIFIYTKKQQHMKKLMNLSSAVALKKNEQKKVTGGILPCPWYFECSITGNIYGTRSVCLANCAGGTCFRFNDCL
jgi:hypothetical protein